MEDVDIFRDKTVLITGGAGEFGRSASQLFAERGARLVLSDVDGKGLAEFAEQLAQADVQVASISGSVANEEHCRQTVDLAMQRFGRLDIAINNVA